MPPSAIDGTGGSLSNFSENLRSEVENFVDFFATFFGLFGQLLRAFRALSAGSATLPKPVESAQKQRFRLDT